ncbi:glycosyltransferase family 2 protein [Rhodovulum euryhalinum]|uniref:Glycosyltransferase involved in cell wall biosynthesis n=1 Tax=Rhodovulum euryhalinum TaxID=35805 RepID=A0A4R2KMQ9_9RHOB|nr:glycosyltransferase family 2 protein [Rhodovulum euryhalinum]TCO72046.1 glycosyltransferase involved in cell wall biosynthesis [Rhodovulum euryhalinum]
MTAAARPGQPPRLTAILACRNAAPTLGRLLEHLARQGAETIVMDHGSTDDTPAIARAHLGAPVTRIVDHPFDGVFDLTRQLRLKREIIRGLGGEGWVLHADADEFLDSPDGTPLREYLALWDESGVLAFDCAEYMFLPRNEGEAHDPARFETTMRHYLPFRERDPKQRLFRADAPLGMWMRTGGHSISAAPSRIAPVALRLRHYFALSLDQVRAEYLSRVFAPGDIARRWHGSRMGAVRYQVVAPAGAGFRSIDAGWSHDGAVTELPLFRPLRAELAPPDSGTQTDLGLVAGPEAVAEMAAAHLARGLPGLRIARVAAPAAGGPPVLHLLAHPACGAPVDGAGQRDHSEAWLRRIAFARQAALAPGARYAELRAEDVEADPEALIAAVRGVMLAPPAHAAGFLARPARPVRAEPFPAAIRAITGALARDLGYV